MAGLLDLDQRTMHWLDVARGVTGTCHAVHRYGDQLAALGEALTGYFASPARVRLGEVALWHAAAGARTVVLRADDGRLSAYTRLPDETVDSFVSLLARPAGADPTLPPAPADLAFLWRGDLPVAPGAQVYALYGRAGPRDRTAAVRRGSCQLSGPPVIRWRR
jgi:hypothetical protein